MMWHNQFQDDSDLPMPQQEIRTILLNQPSTSNFSQNGPRGAQEEMSNMRFTESGNIIRAQEDLNTEGSLSKQPSEQQLKDLNLFMMSSKEKCEEELEYLEKQLKVLCDDINNIQNQIRIVTNEPEQTMYLRNLMSLHEHMIYEHGHLI